MPSEAVEAAEEVAEQAEAVREEAVETVSEVVEQVKETVAEMPSEAAEVAEEVVEQAEAVKEEAVEAVSETVEQVQEAVVEILVEAPAPAEEHKLSWAARLKQGLTKSRDKMAKSLAGVFGGGQIDEDLLRRAGNRADYQRYGHGSHRILDERRARPCQPSKASKTATNCAVR